MIPIDLKGHFYICHRASLLSPLPPAFLCCANCPLAMKPALTNSFQHCVLVGLLLLALPDFFHQSFFAICKAVFTYFKSLSILHMVRFHFLTTPEQFVWPSCQALLPHLMQFPHVFAFLARKRNITCQVVSSCFISYVAAMKYWKLSFLSARSSLTFSG